MKNSITAILVLLNAVTYAQPVDSAVYFFNKGAEEKTAKRYLAAAKQFNKAIQLNPKYVTAFIENGFTHLEMRKINEAKENFIKANELEPDNKVVLNELMHLYFDYHQYEKALELANKCADCKGAEKIIALSYYQKEDYGNAEKALLALVAKYPEDAVSHYTLGRCYLELEAEKKAVTHYEKAVSLDTANKNWLYEMALLYYTVNDYKRAVIYFNKAAANGYFVNNDFMENLGYSYIYSGEFEKGEKLLMELMAKKPGSKEILRDIAQVYYDRKLYDKSLDFCQKLLELDKNDGKALYQAGLCFQKKGQKDRGQAMCDKAIELDPSLSKLKKQQKMGAGL